MTPDKKYKLQQWSNHSLYYSEETYAIHNSIAVVCETVENKLNEQYEIIQNLNRLNDSLIKENNSQNEEIQDLKKEIKRLERNLKIKKEERDHHWESREYFRKQLLKIPENIRNTWIED